MDEKEIRKQENMFAKAIAVKYGMVQKAIQMTKVLPDQTKEELYHQGYVAGILDTLTEIRTIQEHNANQARIRMN
jgi:hypothetical protein